MKVLAFVHGYPPSHNAGSEMMLHTLLRQLQRRGHEAKVLTGTGTRAEHQGVAVCTDQTEANSLAAWCDVIITHLAWTERAFELAEQSHRPLAHLIHNSGLSRYGLMARSCDLVVFNGRTTYRACAPWNGPHLVINPLVDIAEYRTEPGDCITLVNLNGNKGADLFYRLAESMPDRSFLGVVGAYGAQDIRSLPNVEIVANTTEIKQVYSRTRILLMPSRSESWGRTAIEAAASGIPTIASHATGLVEALDYAGVFVHRDDPDSWMAALRAFDNPETYEVRSEMAKQRAEELYSQFQPHIDEVEAALLRLTRRQV